VLEVGGVNEARGTELQKLREMTNLPRRIIKETQRLMQEPVPGISAVPDDGNARYFHVVVAGPEGSPFEGGVFKLELFLPEDYPMSAPKVCPCIPHSSTSPCVCGRSGLSPASTTPT